MPPTNVRPDTLRHLAAWLLLGALLGGCSNKPTKEEEEAARNTFACESVADRIVIRFDRGEARLLLPGGDRVTLYQVPSVSGIRFTNGSMDLRGKGTDLQLGRDGNPPVPLKDCALLTPPKAP
ncbi:MAG: MliC family protein [Casimicrobiaceae bacterium]